MEDVNAVVSVAEAEAEENGVGIYTFIKQGTKIDGVEVKDVAYDFNQLDGDNICHARAELAKEGYFVAVKQLDEAYHAAMFAEAAGISFADVKRFGIKDFSNVADIAKDFMFGEE